MSRLLVAVLALLAFAQPVVGGVRGQGSMHVASPLTSCKAGDRGVLETGDPAIAFTPEKMRDGSQYLTNRSRRWIMASKRRADPFCGSVAFLLAGQEILWTLQDTCVLRLLGVTGQ
ncbi:MAG TPA: hypothetical protein VMT20_20455 [Terriglobia bacterium]|nr:hypothetical protein [Terriglobia bacterium]